MYPVEFRQFAKHQCYAVVDLNSVFICGAALDVPESYCYGISLGQDNYVGIEHIY